MNNSPDSSIIYFSSVDDLKDISHFREMRKLSKEEVLIDNHHMWTYFVHMRKVTLRDLRNNFSMLEGWLEEGEQIQIERRGEPIALLTGLPKGVENRIVMPNFAARRKAIWGGKILGAKAVQMMRAAELEGEQG